MAKRDRERGDLILGVKTGLFEGRHWKRMGPAIWPFLYLLGIPMMDGDDGILQSPQGHKFSQRELLRQIRETLGMRKTTAYRLFDRLVREGYLVKGEDGTWNIARYQNFRTFFKEKKNRPENGTNRPENGTNRPEKDTELRLNRPYKNKNKKGDLTLKGEGEDPPNKKGGPSPEDNEIDRLHRQGMGMLRERCRRRGDVLSGGITSRDAKDLKEMLQAGYTLEQIFACYDSKLNRPDLQGRHLPMEWVKRDLAYWLAERGPTTEEEIAAIPNLYP